MNVEEYFEEVYTKFKLHFYRAVFGNWSSREATLTTVETFCMEVIFAMKYPTINEFANFIGISQPNAAYKVNNLVRKGYVRKIQSQRDKREYFLEATEKYLTYEDISSGYVRQVLGRMKDRLSPEQLQVLKETLKIMTEELMPEVPEYKRRSKPE